MQHIGNLDLSKLGKYRDKMVTTKVILTEERIVHIENHHPGNYQNYNKYIEDIISNPDYIIDDNKNIDTIILLKTINEKKIHIQLVIRLNTISDEQNKYNSIFTLWKVRYSTYRQILRNKEIIWQNLDKEE